MRNKKSLILILLVLGLFELVVAPPRARAGYFCQRLEDEILVCNSLDGCHSHIGYELCLAPGCTYGYCTTGYGECCNMPYPSNNLWPDPGGNDCGLFGCGLVRVHAAPQAVGLGPESKGFLPHGSKPSGPPSAGAVLPDDLIFIPNRCKHSYGMLHRKSLPWHAEGM